LGIGFGDEGAIQRADFASLEPKKAQGVVVGLIMGGFAAKNQTTIASMVVSLHSA
jgi:uncharacterized membrane protein (Fun14 family)